MIKIYHNTRCGKSRCALQEIEVLGKPFEVIEYLKNPPNEVELRHLLTLLGKKPLEIIRQKELVFQENFKGKVFSDDEWIRIIIENPILMERPIVVSGDKAWIARDPESLEAITAS
jgi:arsenate reductase (glutaredoxin)